MRDMPLSVENRTNMRRLLLLAGVFAVTATPALSQQTAVAPAAHPPSATASGGAGMGEIAPGPLMEARKMLWARINQAKGEGIGTAAYVTAFNTIEDDVRAGQPMEAVRPRIESLARSLKDQLDRSKMLKTQRPLPPTASQSGGSGSAGPPKLGSPLDAKLEQLEKSGKQNEILEKIREKLGGGDIPDSLKEKLLNSDKAKKFLDKL